MQGRGNKELSPTHSQTRVREVTTKDRMVATENGRMT